MRLSTPGLSTSRRLRLNPLEVLILCVVCSGFGFSVYNVFKEADQFQFAALDVRQADPTRSARSPASVGAGVPLEIPCSQNPGFHFQGKECPTGDSSQSLRLLPNPQ